MEIYFPDGNGGKQIISSEGATSIPVATDSVLGGVMISDDFTIEPNGKLHLANSTASIPVATNSVLGGIMVSDDFTIEPNGKLHLANSTASIPVATSSVLGGVMISDDFTIEPNGKLHLAQSVDSLQEASSSILGGVRLSPEFRMGKRSGDDARLLYHTGLIDNNVSVTGDAVFNGTVSISSSGTALNNLVLEGTHVRMRGAKVFTGDSLTSEMNLQKIKVTLGTETDAASINAAYSKITLTGASLRADSLTVSSFHNTNDAAINVTSRVSLNNGVSVTGVADFRNAEVLGIAGGDVTITGITNPYNGVLSLTSGADSEGGGIINMGFDTGGKIIMGSESSYPDKHGGSIEGDVHFSGTPIFQSGFLAKTGFNGQHVTIESVDYNDGGTIDMHGAVKGGIISLCGDDYGGTIDASGGNYGGVISLCGDSSNSESHGGTIDASGKGEFGTGGVISLCGDDYGGTIDASGGNYGGVISLCSDDYGGTIDASGKGEFGTGGVISLGGGSYGGTIDANSSNGGYGGVISLRGGTQGGTIDASGGESGGVVNLAGKVGGTIDASGTTAGFIDMHSTAGVRSRSGSISGTPHFTSGFFVGDGDPIQKIWFEGGKLKISYWTSTYETTTYTFTPDA